MREKQQSPEAYLTVDFSFAYHRKRNALEIVAYMEKRGIAERRNTGCFQLDNFNKGDVVRLRKGQECGTTHPSMEGPVKRDRTVKVHRVMPGYTTDLESDHRALVVDPRIEWVGTGSYYFWCDIENITLEASKSLTRPPDGHQPMSDW